MENVLIIGGGHVGVTLAVDLEMRKQETGLSPHILLVRSGDHSFNSNSDSIGIELDDVILGKTHHCEFPKNKVHRFEDNISKLLGNTKIIIVTVPDIPNLRFAIVEWISTQVPHAGVTVVFVRGGQGGLIATIDAWRRTPELRKFNLALVEDSFYGTRYIDQKVAFKRKKKTNISVLGSAPGEALSSLQRLFSGKSIQGDLHRFNLVRPLDLQFDPLGYIIHLAVALDEKNLQLTKQGIQYFHYCDGVHEGNADVIEELDLERVRLAEDYTASTRPFLSILTEQYNLPPQPTFLVMMKSTKDIYRSLSTRSIDDLKRCRLIQEDVPALFVMEWLAGISGTNFPFISKHANNIRAHLQTLEVDIQPYYHYVKSLEEQSMGRNEVIELLTNPI